MTEMAIYDVPAVMTYILNVTGQGKSANYPTNLIQSLESLAYVGHSLGTDIMFALQSLIPEMGAIVKPFVALAPVAYIGHIWSSARLGVILEPILRYKLERKT